MVTFSAFRMDGTPVVGVGINHKDIEKLKSGLSFKTVLVIPAHNDREEQRVEIVVLAGDDNINLQERLANSEIKLASS